MKKKPMTQERLNGQFSVMRTGLAITTGVLLSILIILFVSEDALESVKYLLIGPLMNSNNFFSLIIILIIISIII